MLERFSRARVNVISGQDFPEGKTSPDLSLQRLFDRRWRQVADGIDLTPKVWQRLAPSQKCHIVSHLAVTAVGFGAGVLFTTLSFQIWVSRPAVVVRPPVACEMCRPLLEGPAPRAMPSGGVAPEPLGKR
jgi:hypothetical protein